MHGVSTLKTFITIYKILHLKSSSVKSSSVPIPNVNTSPTDTGPTPAGVPAVSYTHLDVYKRQS